MEFGKKEVRKNGGESQCERNVKTRSGSRWKPRKEKSE